MSLITVASVQYRVFSGYADPALPIGLWFCALNAPGDASGGFMTAQMNFNQATAPTSANFFSLEEVAADITNLANVGGEMIVSNMDSAGVQTAIKEYDMNFDAGAGRGHMNGESNLQFRRLWLGSQHTPATAVALSWTLVNVNGAALFVTAGGYYWSSRSINTPGGPSRPIQGFYPN